jgi:hypothetical protein
MNDTSIFILRNAVILLFVFIYGHLSERRLLPRKVNLAKAVFIILAGHILNGYTRFGSNGIHLANIARATDHDTCRLQNFFAGA